MSAVQACLVATLAACSTKVSLALRRRNQISKRRLLSPQHSVRPRSAICVVERDVVRHGEAGAQGGAVGLP